MKHSKDKSDLLEAYGLVDFAAFPCFNLKDPDGECLVCGTHYDRTSVRAEKWTSRVTNYLGPCGHSLCILTQKIPVG